MKKILITGGNGFIGSNLVRSLVKSKDDIILFINKQKNIWRIKDIISNFEIHNVDLSNQDQVEKKIKKIKPNIVYHLATYGVYPYQNNLDMMIRTNIFGSINLIRALEKNNELIRFVNVGSSFEYGPKRQATSETAIPEPNTLYGVTKVTQSLLSQYFSLYKKLPIVILRVFHAFGMYESKNRLISDIMLSLVQNKVLKLSNPLAKRDFIFINDVIEALKKSSKAPKVQGEILNVGGGQEYSVRELVNLIQKITNSRLKISWLGKNLREFDRTGGKGYANIKKAKELLSWRPKYSLKQGLQQTYNWYQENYQLYT